MENYCWEWDRPAPDVRPSITGALLRALFDKMLVAKISRTACSRCASLNLFDVLPAQQEYAPAGEQSARPNQTTCAAELPCHLPA